MMERFIHAAEKEGVLPYGMTVFRKGKTVWNTEAETGKRYPVYSATKSFTSSAVGLAVEDGLMSTEDRLQRFFPEELRQVPEDAAEFWSGLTVSRLLTMTVPGLPFRPSGDNWLLACLSIPESTDGKRSFWYSNLPAYLAGVIVERAVGENTADYLDRKLFEPMGIPRPDMQFCPSGHFYGATGMKLTAYELGCLGQLYLDRGCRNGLRILSETWTEEAVRCHVKNREGGYGYFFWTREDGGFTIRGKWGQRCYVFPEEQTVVSWVSHLPEKERCERQEELFREFGIPEIL